MTDSERNPDNFCYRHPDRQSFIICQRCGRTVCSECQTQAAVGVHCPECVREARQSAPRVKPVAVTRIRSSMRSTSGVPVVTYSLIGINLALYLATWVSGGALYQALAYWPPLTASEPWRMITSAFMHSPSSILHILFNMFSLFIFGPIIENLVGRGRFIALYLLAALGGSVGVLLLSPGSVVVGASGAIFGLLGAFFVIQRRLGGNSMQLLVVVGLNLVLGFIVPGVAWQAHLGGLIVGAGVAAIYTATRRRQQRTVQAVAVAGVAVALVVMTIVAVAV
ncbi:membrane associated rhomboid family serine protease [Conyzicola nivalis]|uniref:Membrane associated rhomboid family serine protease n=1 Tax=Conyzicola nivalis TaxID=1477021 RepID=A0ABV2QS04_9MICO